MNDERIHIPTNAEAIANHLLLRKRVMGEKTDPAAVLATCRTACESVGLDPDEPAWEGVRQDAPD